MHYNYCMHIQSESVQCLYASAWQHIGEYAYVAKRVITT